MSGWEVAVDLDGTSGTKQPVFLRIARAITDDIRRGRLRGGDALPGSRMLAASLGVHRNTVLAAFRELSAEGWIATEVARGTFVAVDIPDLPDIRRPARGLAAAPGYALHGPRSHFALAMPNAADAEERQRGGQALMTLGGGMADVRLVPTASLARALRRALARKGSEVLAYGEPAGPLVLRAAIAKMLAATRGVAASEDNVLVARGAQMGIDLVARTLAAPGDVIAVEAFGFRPAWAALAAGGARLVPVPVDAHGIDVEALEKLTRRRKIRGVYVTPHHQFPTTVTLAPARRLRLLELARERAFWILEDDYDHEMHFEGRPVLPLASDDPHGVVVYVGTFSKVLAPGMRLGFVVAPAPVVERLALTRRHVDRQGDHLLAHAVAELIEEGEIQRHIRRTRRVCEKRRLLLASLLADAFGDRISFTLPNGGTAIWARVAAGISVDAWAARALDASLVLQPGRSFAFDGRARPYLRLGFAQHDEREVREAVRRLRVSMPKSGRAAGFRAC